MNFRQNVGVTSLAQEQREITHYELPAIMLLLLHYDQEQRETIDFRLSVKSNLLSVFGHTCTGRKV